MTYFGPPAVCARWKKLPGLCALALWLATPGAWLAAQTTNAPQADGASFGNYLVSHQEELAPFFNENGDEMVRQAAPLILGVLGEIMIFTLLTCWVFDVALIRWFSIRFAPAFAKFRRALIYATGRLVLSVLFYALLGMAILIASGRGHEAVVVSSLFLVFLVVELAVQTAWVHYLYSTPVSNALLCYLAIFAVHIITGILVSAPILVGRAPGLVTTYVDTNITPGLQAAADAEKKELAAAAASRDALQAQLDAAQKSISENADEQDQLKSKIEAAKNSPAYLFNGIVKLRAEGNLAAARDQLTDLLNKYPDNPQAGLMKTQLAGLDSDLAAQAAQKQEAEAAAAQAAAQARADLLARAAQGQVTLSEMRQVLVGKKPSDVTALFGPPAATDSNRWGYSQKMVINPLSQDKFGLTVYFSEGTVQGVDYYYGTGGAATQ